jgi:TIR domain
VAYSYWAFVSYARADGAWARALHRRLEGFRIAARLRHTVPDGVPSTARIRPVFLDQQELAASADIGSSLREALDASRYLIVLASPHSAISAWVQAEVRHFVASGRTSDILVVVVGERDIPADRVLPEALSGQEPLWLDGRGSRRPSQALLLRLVAGMLDVGFDVLWQRHRRRRRLAAVAWAMVAVLAVTASVGVVQWVGGRTSESPEQQTAAFRQYLTDDITAKGQIALDQVNITILRAEDLDGNGRLDFFVLNQSSGYCGSGGCQLGV